MEKVAFQDNIEQAHLILENLSSGIITVDSKGIICFINAAGVKIFGYEKEEVLEKPLSILIPEQYRLAHEKGFQQICKGGKKEIFGKTFELLGLRKGGGEFPAEISLSTWTVMNQIFFSATISEITERKETEKKLTKKIKELDFQKFALDAHAIVSITDIKGVITYTNDKFCQISGYSREELMGKSHRIVKSTEHTKQFYTEMWKTIASGKVWRGNIRNRKKEGGSYWVDATIIPFMNEKNRPFQYIAIRTDITERKEAEEAAKSANQAKSVFLSNMSHELRTPLNAILGFAQLLEYSKKTPLSDRQKNQVQQIIKGGEHLLALINDILDLAQIEAGKLSLSIEDIEPKTLIHECLSLLDTLAAKKGVTIENRMNSEIETIKADFLRTKQILLNLCSNAVKYNREGGYVYLDAKQVKGQLRISVTDTGIGISKEYQSELFQPFSRLGMEAKNIEGTGIGLVLTKNLVEQMGGHIGFESVQGEGSTFWIELPLAKKETKRKNKEKNLEYTRPDFHIGTKECLLLYIEDNPANLHLMENIVEEVSGLTLISAPNAEHGLELAERCKPDIIIFDINLPGMDGNEAIKYLQGNPSLKKIPLLALSANVTANAIEKGLKAGFFEYVSKPVDIMRLTTAIKKALKGKS